MNATVPIDKAGRIVLPKAIRDELSLAPGDTLEIESSGECVVLRPTRANAPLRKERGVWVFHGSGTLSLNDANQMIARSRARRDADNLSEMR